MRKIKLVSLKELFKLSRTLGGIVGIGKVMRKKCIQGSAASAHYENSSQGKSVRSEVKENEIHYPIINK